MLDDLTLQSLTIEQLVQQDSSVEDSFHFHEGIWWRRVKPLFYQPAFFFQPIEPGSSTPIMRKALGGYHHLVLESCRGNSHFAMLIHRNIKEYSFDLLPRSARQNIKKGCTFIETRKVIDINDLLTDGYEAYVSFRKRTGWGRDKTNYRIFSQWITKAFRLKKRFFLGAYFKDKLIAYCNPYAVEGMAYIGVIISNSEYLQYRPNDLLLHNFSSISRSSPDVMMANLGASSLKASLDRFKMKYGFELVKCPTYLWLNPFVRIVLRRYFRNKYDQLRGSYFQK